MTKYYAQSSGDLSPASRWNDAPDGSGSSPASDVGNNPGDEFESNGYTIAIDVNPLTVLCLYCDNGGGFTIDLTTAKTVNAAIIGGAGYAADCLTGTGTATLTVVGNCTGGIGQSGYSAGDNGASRGGYAVVAAAVSISGNCTGGAGGASSAAWPYYTGGTGGDAVVATSATVAGDCRGGDGAVGADNAGGAGGVGGNGVTATTVGVTGNCYGGDGADTGHTGESFNGGSGGNGGQGITGGTGSSVSGAWADGQDGIVNDGSAEAGSGGLAFSSATNATPDTPIAQTASIGATACVVITWLDTRVATGTYLVFRDGTQIASGLAYGTTSYTDDAAPIGVSASYTVKATNSLGTSSASNAVAGLRPLIPISIALPASVLPNATTLSVEKNAYVDGAAAEGTYPAVAYVHRDAGTYGPGGTEYTPGLDALSTFVAKTDVVAAEHVELDVPRWSGATGTDFGTLVVESGGSTVLTEQDVSQLRYRLGLDGTATAPVTPTANLAIGVADRNAIADTLLSRPVAHVEATADVGSLCYVVLAMAHASTAAHPGRLTIFRTDGSEFAQRTITSQSGVNPITGVNPWTASTT